MNPTQSDPSQELSGPIIHSGGPGDMLPPPPPITDRDPHLTYGDDTNVDDE